MPIVLSWQTLITEKVHGEKNTSLRHLFNLYFTRKKVVNV